MRINKFVAQATGLSRRAADQAIADQRVRVNGALPSTGQDITDQDQVTLDGKALSAQSTHTTVLLHKPVGYVCSRDGQGSPTVYDLLAPGYQDLKLVGRLDKYSSGLILLTSDGQLAYELTHPKFEKTKVYQVGLNQPLSPSDEAKISKIGVQLDDGLSKFSLRLLRDRKSWQVSMHEGRNRQIRRTFAALGYSVRTLHRTHFGTYELGNLPEGQTAPA